jgi:hypothetical protein
MENCGFHISPFSILHSPLKSIVDFAKELALKRMAVESDA